ncbi:O-antigen ligase family protein [Gordonia sp. KTR9]|uniref:O-antigen ligase family protein n=1 Tax=Gordonia sp. KTR9 TaxID=337191 RepID=UPI00027DDCB4|nr:O-antigen ligase family protein [Gordonia sp. KTR9]AFR47704.1 AraC family regulatory protein [Gordonia sp. KTR9]
MTVVLTLLLVGIACIVMYLDPRFGVAAVMIGYAVVPFAASISLLGVHVCTVMTFAVAFTRLLIPARHLPPKSGRILASIPKGAAGLVAVFVAGSLLSELITGTSPGTAIPFWLNFIVAPVLIFVMCCDLAERYGTFYRSLALGYVLVACAQSMLALLVSRDLVAQPFLDQYMRRFWWHIVDQANRQMGTIDHPLDLGLYIATAIPLLALMRRTWLTYVALIILVFGVTLTQSRIGLLGAAFGIIFLIVTSSATSGRRVILGSGVVGAYLAFNFFGAFDAVSGRIADDSGSADARRSAWTVLLPDAGSFFPFGEGIQRVKPFVASRYGLETSPESAFLGYLVGFGAVLAVCFFAGVCWIVVDRLLTDRSVNPGMASVLIALVSIQLFSSISTGGTITAYVVWICMFFAVAYPVSTRTESSPQGARPSFVATTRSVAAPPVSVERA